MRRIMVVKDEPDTQDLFSRKQIKKRYPNINHLFQLPIAMIKTANWRKNMGLVILN